MHTKRRTVAQSIKIFCWLEIFTFVTLLLSRFTERVTRILMHTGHRRRRLFLPPSLASEKDAAKCCSGNENVRLHSVTMNVIHIRKVMS